jgi:hypothetical protein
MFLWCMMGSIIRKEVENCICFEGFKIGFDVAGSSLHYVGVWNLLFFLSVEFEFQVEGIVIILLLLFVCEIDNEESVHRT